MEKQYKLTPINAGNDHLFIHVFRDVDMIRVDGVVDDLFAIFNNIAVKQYSPERYVIDKKILDKQLAGVILSYQMQLGYTHYVTWKDTGRIIAQIDIITPKRAEQIYTVKQTWFIEYYLNEEFWGYGMMTDILIAVIDSMRIQGIEKIGAVCMPNNIASRRVLEKCGFKRIGKFDALQDYYTLS